MTALLLAAVLSAPPTPAPTFTKDVAPILFAQCVTCHRPGAIAPFSLQTYADAKKRSGQLARVTHDRIMPPWKPEPGHGEFLETRRLSEAEIATLANWAIAGSPEGNPAELPKLPKFPEGWQLGKPDLVLRMPEPFKVPAEGRDVYWQFVFPLNLKKDTYLRAVECRPGNPRVAHHAVGILDTSGSARKLDAKYPGPGYPGIGPGFVPAGFTPGYVPGAAPRYFPNDVAITLTPAMDFVLQMHYHPTGKEEQDQTEIAFYFSDKPPAKHMVGIGLGSEEIDIAAGDSEYQARDKFTLPVDVQITDVWAHMHMIGKATRVWADLPDGSKKKLLKISDWDFNWQDSYRYREPFRLPKGTVIHAEWTWDNSSSNPRNPNQPPKRIRQGEGSTDEMSGIWIGGIVDTQPNALTHWGAVVGHYIEISWKGLPYKRP